MLPLPQPPFMLPAKATNCGGVITDGEGGGGGGGATATSESGLGDVVQPANSAIVEMKMIGFAVRIQSTPQKECHTLYPGTECRLNALVLRRTFEGFSGVTAQIAAEQHPILRSEPFMPNDKAVGQQDCRYTKRKLRPFRQQCG
jgi:hypothetical protein